jgi:ketosteroid isomerase-like protein
MAKMRGLAALALGLCLAAGAAAAQDDPAMAEIGAVLKAHDEALSAHDVDAVLATYAAGEDIVLMGTGPGEFWQGREAIAETYKRFMADFDAGSMKAQCPWKDGHVESDAGWFVGSCVIGDMLGGMTREFVLNVSAFLRKEDGAWRLHILHYSNLAGNQ